MAALNTPLTAHLLEPARYAVLDCETGDAPTEAIEAAIGAWKAPKTWKPETVAAKREEQAGKIADKASLLDASPILCLALKTDRMAVILNGMDESTYDIPGWLCLPCGNEHGLLIALRSILDAGTVECTTLVCHNAKFDLPKLRNAYLRHRLKLPAALQDQDQPLFDTLREIRYFSMENADERFISLDTVARVLGIPSPKQVISGADCPRLHRDGEHGAILTYCALDVATTERAYLLMAGHAAELV